MTLKRFFHSPSIDWSLVGSAIALNLVGLVTLYALSQSYGTTDRFFRQLVFFVIGVGVMFLASSIDYQVLKGYHSLIYIGVLGVLVMTLMFGTSIRGTRGWIVFLNSTIQPVEFVKVFIILTLSAFFSNSRESDISLKGVFFSCSIVVLPSILIWLQPDFGSSLILFIVWFVMLTARGITKKQFILLALSAVTVFVVGWFGLFQEYQKERVLSFVGLRDDPLGISYNVHQSVTAIGAGGVFGQGLGQGIQGQLRFLPEGGTDFIFAVISEEFGMLGGTVILMLFAYLFYRILKYIRQLPDDFSRYFGFGIGLIFFAHFALNIGMNLGLFPVIGVPLPFVSAGGSALVAAWMMIGLLQSVYKRSGVV